MSESTIDILRRWQSDGTLGPFVAQLNSMGIVSDEDHVGVSASMAKGWSPACESLIRAHGYMGGSIVHLVTYFENSGNIHALYDMDAVSQDEANAYLKAAASRNPPL